MSTTIPVHPIPEQSKVVRGERTARFQAMIVRPVFGRTQRTLVVCPAPRRVASTPSFLYPDGSETRRSPTSRGATATCLCWLLGYCHIQNRLVAVSVFNCS